MKLQCFFDGSIGPRNPGGTASYGFIINSGGETIKTGRGIVGTGPLMSNNVAEASGLIAILECILDDYPAATEIKIFGDSNITIQAMRNFKRNPKGLYSKYIFLARFLADELYKRGTVTAIRYEWIPREKNAHADKLADYRKQQQEN